MKIAVIGSGVAGLTAAYFLSRDQHEVTVFETESGPAKKCSYANGGQISVSNSEVWTTWSNVWKGMKWMLKKDAPLLIRPELDIDKALWLAKFLYHTANSAYTRNTVETICMGLEGRQALNEISSTENIHYDQEYKGILHFYKNSKYFSKAKEIKNIYEDHGCEWEVLTANQMYDLDPALNHIRNVVGAVYTKSDWSGDIHKFCTALTQILEKKYGVNFNYNLAQQTIDEQNFDCTVVAAGVDSVAIAKSYGEVLPIYPVKGYSITIPAEDVKNYEAIPKVSLLDDEYKIVCSKLGNKLRVAGTAELVGHNYTVRKDRIEPLLKWVKTNLPTINTEQYSEWACLRPMTPNMMPIVGISKIKRNVYYHTGHGHLGWTISAGTAKRLAKIIKERK